MNGFFADRTASSSRIMVLFIDREIVHACHMCILVLAEDLEARAPKSSPQTETPGNTPRAKARPTPRRAAGLAGTAGAGWWMSSKIGSDGKPEVFSLFRAKRSSRKVLNV